MTAMSRSKVLLSSITLTTAVALTGVGLVAHNGRAAAAAFPNDDQTILHVLNRTGFGPRPGDVQRVGAMGLQRYIETQLHAERIPDSSMSARLSGLATIRLSSREIAETYEMPQLAARRDRKAESATTHHQPSKAP